MFRPFPLPVLFIIVLYAFGIDKTSPFLKYPSSSGDPTFNRGGEIISCLPSFNPSFSDPLEEILINDNSKPAGVLKNGVLHLELEARVGIWYPESHEGRGIRVYAFAEKGKPMQLPGPLIRVPEGTLIQASILNLINDEPMILRGFHSRPESYSDSILIPYKQTSKIQFKSGVAGTYLYKASASRFRTKRGNNFFSDSQLYGAFIVDPSNKKADSLERILIIGFWNDTLKGQPNFDREEKAINGLTWPYTEQLSYRVNQRVNWRIINASNQPHPMHLHGFFYTVNGRGNMDSDHIYQSLFRYRSVTELLEPGETMSITWLPEREGNWLFHCHTLVHITPDSFLRDGMEMNDQQMTELATHARKTMGGLIMGIHVLPESGARKEAGESNIKERDLTLIAREQLNMFDTLPGDGFILKEGKYQSSENISVPGPPLILTRNQPVAIKVINQLREPTTIHWHGLEIESYFDGVSGWGNRGAQLAPLIMPGDSFVVHMIPPRAGTFIYHTHMHSFQVFAGMYGAIIVQEPGEKFQPGY